MGVGIRSKAWHFTDINKDYTVRSPSPVRLAMFTVTLVHLCPLVLFNIPLASCRADKDQRCDITIRCQVPQQGAHTNPYLLALGKLREPFHFSQTFHALILNREVSPDLVNQW
jgi:hypothetical protein